MRSMNNAPITATQTERERLEAISRYEVKQLFNEVFPTNDNDRPF